MTPVLQNVLSRLQGVRKDGRGWKALCPAHADRNTSVKVDEAEAGKVLLKCFAGCRTEDIVAAIGLNMSNLYLEPERKRKVIAAYDYKDASGKLLFQVCRTADKRFFQRRPDGKGGWVNGLGDIKPVLYRLPELFEAVKRGETVFIPEGEKDADNLARLGLAATTSPMGAGKWRDYYSDWLKGANVVILPDNDEPGRKHAQQVAQSLHGKAKSIKILELPGLPSKGDVSDWLAAGGTKEELLRLAEEALGWEPANKPRPVIVRLAEVEPEEVAWLWEPYIPLGKLTILEGDPGVGKTWLALQLAAIVSRGAPFPGPDGVPKERREPANVVYLSAEDGLADTLRPRLDKAGADVSRVFALTGWEGVDPETGQKKAGSITLAALDVIEAALRQVKPALVVVDPIQAYMGAGVDMHRANEVRPVLAGLAALAERYKCAALCIRHLGKSQQDRAIYRGLGSIDFAAAARSILLVGQHPEDERKRVLAQSKNSLAAKGASIAFELREDGFFWCGVANVTAEALLAPAKSEEEKSAVDEAADFLREALADGPRPAEEILKEARKAGIAERTLNRAKAQLGVRTKRIGEPGKRGGGTWHWYLDCHDDILNQNPIKTYVGNLNQNPQALEPQGIQATDLDCHVATLIKSTQTLEPQGFSGTDLDCQPEPLEGNLQDGQDGHLEESPLNTSFVHLEKSPGSLDTQRFLQDGQEKQLSILNKTSNDKGLRAFLQDGQAEPLEKKLQDGQGGHLNIEVFEI